MNAVKKNVADWCELISVALFAVGLLQSSIMYIVLSMVVLGASLWLTE